jgi:hypothetical protein
MYCGKRTQWGGLVLVCIALLFLFIGGFVVKWRLYIPCGSTAIYGLGSRRGFGLLCYRKAIDARLAGAIISFGSAHPLQEGRADVTSPEYLPDRGPTMQWREYRTVVEFGGVTLLSGRTASRERVPGGYSVVSRTTTDAWVLRFPWWPLLGVLSVFLAARIRNRVIVRSRERRGCCTHCGYNLAHTPGRCPECGSLREQPTKT